MATVATADTVVAHEVPVPKKAKHGSRVVYADELSFPEHVFLNPIYVNKQKGFKLVKVQCADTNPSALLIQFNSGNGRIPQKFGVDTSTHGKTYLTFAVPCEAEYQAMLAFQHDAKEYAKAHKHEWWAYPVSDSQIDDNFAGIISGQKERDGGGHWPANMKVMIPLDDTTGEPKDCAILDEDGHPIPMHDLPGRKWDKVLVEVSGIYFQNRFNWGFGPKTLRLVQLTEDDNVEPSRIDYAAIALRGRDSVRPLGKTIDDHGITVNLVPRGDPTLVVDNPGQNITLAEHVATLDTSSTDTKNDKKKRKKTDVAP